MGDSAVSAGCARNPNKAVIDRDNYHASDTGKPARVEIVAFPGCEITPMNPDHHGTPGWIGAPLCSWAAYLGLPVTCIIRHVHIQEQAIFGAAGYADEAGCLRAMAAEFRRIEDPGPTRVRLRRLPAQISDRRSGIGNPEKLIYPVRRRADH